MAAHNLAVTNKKHLKNTNKSERLEIKLVTDSPTDTILPQKFLHNKPKAAVHPGQKKNSTNIYTEDIQIQI
jgi:hypothetical protein